MCGEDFDTKPEIPEALTQKGRVPKDVKDSHEGQGRAQKKFEESYEELAEDEEQRVDDDDEQKRVISALDRLEESPAATTVAAGQRGAV